MYSEADGGNPNWPEGKSKAIDLLRPVANEPAAKWGW
jgi:hypothetical protein